MQTCEGSASNAEPTGWMLKIVHNCGSQSVLRAYSDGMELPPEARRSARQHEQLMNEGDWLCIRVVCPAQIREFRTVFEKFPEGFSPNY